jgi:site-specific recombinase XerD
MQPKVIPIETATTAALPVPIGADLQPIEHVPAERHPVAVYLARLSPSSRETMHGALEVATSILTGGRLTAGTVPWQQLGYQHMAALRAKLAENYAPSTSNRYLTAVRCVLKECWRLGLMTHEAMARACDIQQVKGARLPKGRALTHLELTRLFEACAEDSSVIGRRDAAVLAVLYGAGLRRSEAVKLDLADYSAESGELKVRQAKGNKDRLMFCGNGSADAMRAWLAVRGDTPGPLFLPINKGKRLQWRRMTDKSIVWILEQRALQAGVKAFPPHDMRRSFISSLLGGGVDLVTVSAMAGHASVTTTARYDRRGDDQKRKAAGLLIVPYAQTRACG